MLVGVGAFVVAGWQQRALAIKPVVIMGNRDSRRRDNKRTMVDESMVNNNGAMLIGNTDVGIGDSCVGVLC
jgi:hypothetical protein